MTSPLKLLLSFALSVCLFQTLTIAQIAFDSTEIRSFPARFFGDNAAGMYQIFEKYQRSFAKSEFETTNEFADRMRGLIQDIKFSTGRTAIEQFTFVSNDFEQSYDADEGLLKIKINLGNNYHVSVASDTYNRSQNIHRDLVSTLVERQNSWVPFKLWSNSKVVKTAVGKTAFGVKKRFRITSNVTVNVALHDPKLGAFYDSSFTLNIKMNPNVTRKISKNTLIAVTGVPMFPFITKNISSDGATLTDPEEAPMLVVISSSSDEVLPIINIAPMSSSYGNDHKLFILD